MTHAPAPQRASLTFSISFGLLNIPVAGFTSTEDIAVKRAQYLADGSKVGVAPCIKNDDGTYGEKVEKSDIVKRFASDNGLVDLTDDEIDNVLNTVPGVSELIAVLRFDHLANGTYVPNGKVWQIRAAKLGSGRDAKPNPGGEKAFALLLAALKAENSFALLRFSRAGTVYLGALLPTGRLVGLYHDDEVREDRDIPGAGTWSEGEFDFARQLLQTAALKQAPVVENDSVAKVTAYANAKAAGQAPVAAEAAAPLPTAIDLIATLKASIEAAKGEKVSA